MGIKITNAVVDNHGGTFMRVRGEYDVEIDGLDIRNYTVDNFRPTTFDLKKPKS